MTARYQLLDRGVFDHQTRSVVTPDLPEWTTYREWLTAGGVPLPMDSIGQDDLPTAQAKRIAEIEAYAAGLRNKVIAGYSAGEMAAWTIKTMEAHAYLASQSAADAPLLSIEAAARGIPLADLCAKVLAKANQFYAAEGALAGICGKHGDAVAAMTDVRDVIVYDWMTGWPVA